ncbi:MAG TPA: hypothetical protein VGG45_13235 [Terracidiphilus sp.]|jgi:hypothetical protein
MLPRPIFSIGFFAFVMLAAATPMLAQVEPSATGTDEGSLDESQMMTPPPVSGIAYPSGAASDQRSNYLGAKLTFSPAYIDNVLPGTGLTPVSDEIYSILPGVSFDRSAPRQKAEFTYNPSFTFYQHTTSLDAVDHNASALFEYRFSPKLAFSAQDSFTRTSNVYDSPGLISSPITGSTLAPTLTVIAPYAEQMMNTVDGVLSYQFALNAMVGGGGSYNIFDFPNPAQAQGLFNSHQAAGFVFYSRRLSRAQYLGVQYEYARIDANPVTGVVEAQIHSLLPFYTVYFNKSFSFSISAGVQRVEFSQPGLAQFNAWSPTGTASAGWQGQRGSVAASFTRTVISGEGLLGAYNSNSASATGGWKIANTWDGALFAGYSSISSATPVTSAPFQSGNTLTGGATLQHSFGERWNAGFQYQHLHENYNGISAVNATPDSNREALTISYQLRKPLGR